MRIVITISQISPGGGLTKYVCTLADILTKEGENEIWVITTHKSEPNPEFEKLKEERGIHYISLSDSSKYSRYFKMAKVIRRIKPDVVIGNYNGPTQYVLPLLGRKVKKVHIIHNDTPDFYRLAAINGRHTDLWIVPTPAIADNFNSFTKGKYSERVKVIPHAVDEAGKVAEKRNSVAQLTYVGALSTHKGVQRIPEILKGLRNRGKEFHFTFIGEGFYRERLDAELTEEIKEGLVEFTGRVPAEEVYRRLADTDIFVYPSYYDSFGLVIAEAMTNGAVPVVSNLRGIFDTIVDEGVNGFLPETGDVEGFVERIEYLIDNPEIRKRMGAAAREKVHRSFTKDIMRRNYLEALNDLWKK